MKLLQSSFQLLLLTTTTLLPPVVFGLSTPAPPSPPQQQRKKVRLVQGANSLIEALIVEEECFTTTNGAREFEDACAPNIVYEDCYEPQPIVGSADVGKHLLGKIEQRQGKGKFRLDKISDGKIACGFAWTWTCGEEEGLRGTTFVELNEDGKISYVREIPEPIFKPGNLTLDLLKAVTAGAEEQILPPYETKTPTDANDIVKYLFNDVQGRSADLVMDFFDERIQYRDFNFEDMLVGKKEVKGFIEDFTFPGLTFRTQRFDDGILSTCFTWEVVVLDAPDTIKGISFYEIDPTTRKVTYVRDVPESGIKPPILGKLARLIRPGLGTFQGVPIGSRPNGM
eukprot:CAMPEP_0194132196 /NCGR_PEP_ID=MMETSP0152-20130528/2726_1 /TAXON_ID=1049557 /ORGANISM="Thalassiothrix antarctica, Strain L6-D1" /LENGTH=339 /DNA_ID=CAMNT_0038827161 /DNA_START=63 /DNA_END=1082 /DNA_ORIENTATION=-